jgi:hypothetical protein
VLCWGYLGSLSESYGGLVELPVKYFGVVVIWWTHEAFSEAFQRYEQYLGYSRRDICLGERASG